MKQYQSYKCNKCGNVVEVQNVGGGELHCCGQAMEMITKDLTSVVLMKAFAGESMARNKYEYFAKIAQKEGFRDIAEHFQRAANNEKMHAKLELKAYNVLNYDKEFGNTSENLQYAIDGESYENVTMYPEFAKVAKEEGHSDIARMLDMIGKIEIEHENMYKSLKKITEEEFKKLSKKLNIIKMDSSGETFQFTYSKKQNKYICKYSPLSENFNQSDF